MNVYSSNSAINEIGDAWLLHKKPTGDSSIHLSFFTRTQGLVHCWFRGARTLKKQSPVQAFTPMWLATDTRHDWHYVHKLEMTAPTLKLGGLSLFAALYINELLYYVLSIGESCEELFTWYELTLKSLTSVTNRLAIEVLLRRFEMHVLSVCGHGLLLTEEVQGNQRIVADACYQFSAGKGFLHSKQGFPGHLILAWADGQWQDLQVLKLAKLVMRQAIDHLLDGRPLKSRALFQVQPS